MDPDRDMDKTKWVLIAGGLFFVSCFMVWSERMYFLNSRKLGLPRWCRRVRPGKLRSRPRWESLSVGQE